VNVVVTGGSGQLGSLIVANLIADRRVKRVVTIDLRPPALVSPKLVHHTLDIRHSGLAERLAFADALVHLAFLVTQPAPTEEMVSVNVAGSRAVFEAAAAAGVKTLIHASSIAAYGVVSGQPEPLIESSPRKPSPRLLYGTNKYEVERFLDGFAAAHPELRVVCMRPAIMIGRRMDHLFGKLLARRVLLQVGDAPLPIVWDEDVADAFVLALFGSARGAFNLAADQPLPADQLATRAGLRLLRAPGAAVELAFGWSKLLEQVGRRAPIDPGWLDASGVRLIASSARAVEELGWHRRAETTSDVLRRYVAEVPERIDPRIALFMTFVDAGMRRLEGSEVTQDLSRIDADIHLDLSGPRGGDFALRVRRGQARIRRGVPRPPTTVVKLSAATLLDVLAGSTDMTTAQLTGRLKITGDPLGGFVLGAIVTSFRRGADATGARGLIARGLGELLRLGRPTGAPPA
jgi:nucleoside-diphosphate-sugar epimerase/putative sterol carrier protein